MRAAYTSDSAFTAKIADPLVGGTYITLMNTCSNFGRRISTTFYLWLLDKITWRKCDDITRNSSNFTNSFNFDLNKCSNHDEMEICENNEGHCDIIVDGYYIEIFISLIYGLVWMKIFKSIIDELQRYKREDWFVLKNSNKNLKEMKALNEI